MAACGEGPQPTIGQWTPATSRYPPNLIKDDTSANSSLRLVTSESWAKLVTHQLDISARIGTDLLDLEKNYKLCTKEPKFGRENLVS